MPKDRRIFDRLEDIVNIRYAVDGRDKEKLETVPKNIGAGGVGICLTEKLQPGTTVKLEITVPDNPQKTILGIGEVLWTRPFGIVGQGQGVNLHETGIKFIEINQLAIGRIYSYFRTLNRT